MKTTSTLHVEVDVTLQDELEDLRRAFPPHPIDPTNAFAEWGGTYLDGTAFRDGVRGKRWTELDAEFLERQHDAILFLGPTSLPEYLPAYLTKLVSRDPALSAMPSFLLGALTREAEGERFDARFGCLTAEQLGTIARTLAAHERELDGSSRQSDVSAALNSYWRELIGARR